MDAEDIMKSLANEKRLKIIENLPSNGVTTSSVSEHLGITPAAADDHLKKLEQVRILRCSKEPIPIGPPTRRFRLNRDFNFEREIGPIKISINTSKSK